MMRNYSVSCHGLGILLSSWKPRFHEDSNKTRGQKDYSKILAAESSIRLLPASKTQDLSRVISVGHGLKVATCENPKPSERTLKMENKFVVVLNRQGRPCMATKQVTSMSISLPPLGLHDTATTGKLRQVNITEEHGVDSLFVETWFPPQRNL